MTLNLYGSCGDCVDGLCSMNCSSATPVTAAEHIAHDMRMGRFPERSTPAQFLSEGRPMAVLNREAVRAACERLEARLQGHHGDGYLPAHANPDGPEAAALIRSQAERVKALEGALEPFVGEHDCDGHATVDRFDMEVSVSVRWSDVIKGRAAIAVLNLIKHQLETEPAGEGKT